MSYYLEAYLVEDFNQSLGTANFSHFDAIRQILKPETATLPMQKLRQCCEGF